MEIIFPLNNINLPIIFFNHTVYIIYKSNVQQSEKGTKCNGQVLIMVILITSKNNKVTCHSCL